jgi:hypothetical protein
LTTPTGCKKQRVSDFYYFKEKPLDLRFQEAFSQVYTLFDVFVRAIISSKAL